MGTVIVLDVYAGDDVSTHDLDENLHRALSVLHDADEMFSTWDSESPMSQFRRGELTLDLVPDVIGEVLDDCSVARTLTAGWFDPWAMPGGVDPTGYVKGWAAQRALGALTSGCDDVGAIVNAAGDIATRARSSRRSPFRIGVTNPHAPHRLAAVVDVDGAIATSGTYERGSHLINPWTGQHGTRADSATVTGPDLGTADALATALAVAGREFFEVIETLEAYEGFIIEKDGSRHFTTGFPFSHDSESLVRPS